MPTTSTGTGRDVVGLVSYAEPPGRDRLSSGRPVSNASSSRGQQADMGMVNLAMDETSLDGRVSRGSQVDLRGSSYSTIYGGDGASVSSDRVLVRADGSKVIITPDRQDWREERPIKQKDMKFLKYFSIAAIVLFFPTGIPALVFALRTKTAFESGLERGDLDQARKYSKMTERLIIISLILGLLTYVLIFALVERSLVADKDGVDLGSYGHRTP